MLVSSQVPPLPPQSIAPFYYYKVQSHLLYQSIDTLIQEQNIEVLSESVISIAEGGEEAIVVSYQTNIWKKGLIIVHHRIKLPAGNLLKQSFWGFTYK